MSDRINAFLVVLDKDYRDDDSEIIKNTLGMVKGVIDVIPNVSNVHSQIAESRVKRELTDKLFKVIKES